MMTRLIHAVAALAAMIAVPAQAVPVVYTTDASFLAAAGVGLTFEGFETAVPTGTVVTFAGGTFSCSGSASCPSFFGVSTIFADTGARSVFYATPDIATFLFGAPITAFGIAIGGAGDVSPITLAVALSNGATAPVLTNYSGAFDVFHTNRAYFGVIDTVPFVSLTFTANNSGDGVFFDTLNYGRAQTSQVPLPGTLALLGLGICSLSLFRRRG